MERSARDRVARVLEALAAAGVERPGLAWILHPRVDSIVRGDRALATERETIVRLTLDDAASRPAPVELAGRALVGRTRPLPHGWILGTLFDSALEDAAVRARIDRAYDVLARAIRGAPPG